MVALFPKMLSSFSLDKGKIQMSLHLVGLKLIHPPAAKAGSVLGWNLAVHSVFWAAAGSDYIRSHVASIAGTRAIPRVSLDCVSLLQWPGADFTPSPLSNTRRLFAAFRLCFLSQRHISSSCLIFGQRNCDAFEPAALPFL